MNATAMGFAIALAIWIACIARVVWSRRIDGMPKAFWAIAVTLCPLLLVAFLLCVEYPRPKLGCMHFEAVQGCTARESITRVIDSTESSPGVYRTRRA